MHVLTHRCAGSNVVCHILGSYRQCVLWRACSQRVLVAAVVSVSGIHVCEERSPDGDAKFRIAFFYGAEITSHARDGILKIGKGRPPYG